MTEQRWSIPLDDLVSSARVPLAEQVEEQADPPPPPTDRSVGVHPYGDGMTGDVDGD